MTLKNNRAPLLSIIKLYASFHHHMWIQTRVTVRKRLSWVLTSVTLTFDLWPRPFAWTSLLSLVITPENFMMIWWWEHGKKVWRTDGQTDRQTDRRTDWTSHIAAWSQLKNAFQRGLQQIGRHFVPCLHSMRPGDGIWQQRSWSTKAQVMAWCHQATSHYPDQCWLMISKV